MRFFLDQSGKWEESGPTALGISDEKSFELSLFVDAGTKRAVNRYLRSTYQEKNKTKSAFQVRCFTYLIFLALRKTFRKNDELIIDLEYARQDQRIRDCSPIFSNTMKKSRFNPAKSHFNPWEKNRIATK
ncbi:hypothetical protein HYV43_03745 [Candidatus Micrarchaeota archaeon]|nr:hypothetical protein [Candidatus Micrarchaeota archaeon]